jgi:predicted transcriptional regulator
MKPPWQVERALDLAAAGKNNCEISRELGVNRRTVSDWVAGRTRTGPGRKRQKKGAVCVAQGLEMRYQA